MVSGGKEEGVLLKDGKTSVTGCMYVPGFLRCKVRASVDGHVYEGLATVAYAPEELRPHTSLPADFRQFWDTVLKEPDRFLYFLLWSLFLSVVRIR